LGRHLDDVAALQDGDSRAVERSERALLDLMKGNR
jgi:hypothetical protein